ncbi:MAG: zf-HC2 domain-containing protein [Planctomycetes bacterium]|nr:zf-HC2 domain-containing protein [Planctomycetota bacterium]
MSQPFTCGDKDTLVAYLYDEADPLERERVAAHLASCEACRTEFEELRSVRTTLADWTPPARALAFRLVQTEQADDAPRRSSWRIPAWAHAAAAVLVLGVAAGIANLDIRLGTGGVVIRTGWQQAPAQPAPAATRADGEAQPWAADLTALEQRLLKAVAAQPVSAGVGGATQVAAVPAAVSQDQVRSIVRPLLTESEQRQQRELALRVAELQRDLDGQRRADLVRIQEGFGQLGGWTGAEVTRQRQMLDYLLRVNSQQIK